MCFPFIIFSSPTVEESSSKCTDEPVAVGETPEEDSTLSVLPYEQITINVQYSSQTERCVPFLPLGSPQFQTTVLWLTGPASVVCSVSEVAVVGPPDLYRVGFKTVDPLAMMSMAWIRSPNNLTSLLPICFAVNSNRCGAQWGRKILTLCEHNFIYLYVLHTLLIEIYYFEPWIFRVRGQRPQWKLRKKTKKNKCKKKKVKFLCIFPIWDQ